MRPEISEVNLLIALKDDYKLRSNCKRCSLVDFLSHGIFPSKLDSFVDYDEFKLTGNNSKKWNEIQH